MASHEIIPRKLVTDYDSWFKENQTAKGRKAAPDEIIKELFIPEAQRSAAMEDAKSLPKLDIGELDLQWMQVGN